MRLLERNSAGEIYLKEFVVGDVPPYAILSHTWGTEEVTFRELMDGKAKGKLGYDKIQFCSDQASRDNLRYFWVDTCCIDKSSSAELQEAINLMFRWYNEAARCYVYLADVSTKKRKTADGLSMCTWEPAFCASRWFTRGWTLQELLAPDSVEFFSREGSRLGDKRSLEQRIHDITGISPAALRGSRLSDFTIRERMAWVEKRETTCKEDKAYALLGIFDVYMPLIYGEGEKNAFRRLQEEIRKVSKSEPAYDQSEDRCLADLRSSTDPRDDKMRIEDTKGGLLRDSYRWVLDNDEFQQWRNDKHGRLLWIKGDPGKGKTMLLCGIIDELRPSTKLAGYVNGPLLSYFFCQATDSRINSATAVLRGLIYLLVKQQPSLISHIRTKYDDAGKALFEDVNSWVALSEILTKVLGDPNVPSTYLVIDALDECTTDLSQLLSLVVRVSSANPRVKWIVSSRNWPAIEEQLDVAFQKTRLCLELNEKSISTAVNRYIYHKVDHLAKLKKYDDKTRDTVQRHLHSNANDTFLWVALVCQDLARVTRRKVLDRLNIFPPDLDSLYQQMMNQIRKSDDEDLYQQILAVVSTVYRPISLDELTGLIKALEDVSDDYDSLAEVIGYCGSFLILRGRTIFFVHQSAKDFLSKRASSSLFPYETRQAHYDIFSQSLAILSETLRRDIYSLKHPGSSFDNFEQPKPDPLAKVQYSCVHWVDHLHDSDPTQVAGDLQDGGSVDQFLRRSYLHWLEALSLLRSMSAGVLSMAKLESLLKHACQLPQLVRDMRRFIQYYKWVIENSPLQVYASALIFSPARSITRNLFKHEEPNWIVTKPAIEDKWSACIQMLGGDGRGLNSVVFSPNGHLLASASRDPTIRLWDLATGSCTQKLNGHISSVFSLTFSPSGHLLASASEDRTIRLWDPAIGACTLTLKGHTDSVKSVAFSPDSQLLASASTDCTIRLWNPATGACTQTLEGQRKFPKSVSFSPDGRLLASGGGSNIKIWDLATEACTQTLERHHVSQKAKGYVSVFQSIALSPNGQLLAGANFDCTIRLWDPATGAYIRTLECNSSVYSVKFSPNSQFLAAASIDPTVRLWDPATGACILKLEGHTSAVYSVAFSLDGQFLASASADCTIRLWDIATEAYIPMLEKHSSRVMSVTFSPNGQLLASASGVIIKLWDLATGAHIRTIEMSHNVPITNLIFSPDSKLLAVVFPNSLLSLWDLAIDACIQTLDAQGLLHEGLTFSPDSQLLASTANVGKIRIWSLATGVCTQRVGCYSREGVSIAFSPDGQSLASESRGYGIRLWDIATGACKQTFKGHRNVCAVAFSPSGRSLASTSANHTLKLWDIATGVCKKTFHVWRLGPIAFNGTGSHLVTGMGCIAIDSYLTINQTPIMIQDTSYNQNQPQYQGYGISPGGDWILWNGKNILWLPPEYRPWRSAAAGMTIAIGCTSGQVLVLVFAANGL